MSKYPLRIMNMIIKLTDTIMIKNVIEYFLSRMFLVRSTFLFFFVKASFKEI